MFAIPPLFFRISVLKCRLVRIANMKKRNTNFIIRRTAMFVTAGFLIVGLGGASIVGPVPMTASRHFVIDPVGTQLVRELSRVGLLRQLSQDQVEELLTSHQQSKKPLAEILRQPKWLQRLGLSASTYKATWYASNPFELLPVDLQISIRRTQRPFKNRTELNQWLDVRHAPVRWRKAIDLALIETTVENLWRASRGKRPYAKNGQYLQPIVVEKSKGVFDVQDGHIATDPAFIPTNSRVLILVKINGQERILRVKAADIGAAIKGKHVDLPISIQPRYGKNHAIQFPGDYIRNPEVLILSPSGKVSRDRKA